MDSSLVVVIEVGSEVEEEASAVTEAASVVAVVSVAKEVASVVEEEDLAEASEVNETDHVCIQRGRIECYSLISIN